MVATKSDQLLANRASTVRFSPALSGVRDDSLHLVTRWRPAIRIATLAGMNQALDAPLDRADLVVVLGRLLVGDAHVEAELLHLVGMALLGIAWDAEIIVVTGGAVVPGFHTLRAGVAVVNKLVLVLGVQLVQQRHRRILCPPKAGELKVLFPSHCQEGIATVHELARHERIGVHDRAEVGRALSRVQPDGEEHLLVLFHGGKHFGRQIAAAILRGLFGTALPLGQILLLFLLILFLATLLAIAGCLWIAHAVLVASVIVGLGLGGRLALLLLQLLLSGLLLLLEFPNILLEHVRPEVALEVGQLRRRLEVIL